MTTTLQAHGGGAQPASIDTSGKIAGGVALRVYGFDSAEDARAAGYICEGGPAMSVALITDAQIASGAWKAEGDPSAMVVYTAPANLPVEGGYAVPVYAVNGWGSAAPAPVPPLFVSAEVGTVNASTVAVTFDQDVSASDYSAGVTIKVDGTATSIASATRQGNHAIVYYVIPVLWHGSGDVVTWEYAQASGNIIAEDDSTPLSNVTAQSVTNNCEYAALLDLQADALALNDGDPVSTWADQSGQSHDFAQTGTARPLKQTISGYPAVSFDGVNDFMDGGEFADNLLSFTVMTCLIYHIDDPAGIVVSKELSTGSLVGWLVTLGGENFYLYQDALNFIEARLHNFDETFPEGLLKYIYTGECIDYSELHCYRNSSNAGEDHPGSIGAVTNISNAAHVEIASTGTGEYGYSLIDMHAVLIFSPAPSATNRAALEARLAARYGVTL